MRFFCLDLIRICPVIYDHFFFKLLFPSVQKCNHAKSSLCRLILVSYWWGINNVVMYMYACTVHVGASLNEIISSLPDDGGLFWSGVASSVWWTHPGSRAWTRRCGVGARRGNSADYPLIRNRIALQWTYSPNRCNLVHFSEGSFHCHASRSCLTWAVTLLSC